MTYIQSIEIENFRGVEALKLEFDSNFNLIIGDNGVGKTSILEAIAIALGGLISGLDEVKTVNFQKDDIRRIGSPIGDGSFNIEYCTPVSVSCSLVLNEAELSFTRARKGVKSSRTSLSNHAVSKVIMNNISNDSYILPLISYQSAGRMWVQKREMWENLFKSNYSRSIGYLGCLNSESNMKLFTNWCKKMEQISWQKNCLIGEYEAIKSTVAFFMDNLMDRHTKSTIFYDKQSEELMYMDEVEATPLRLMSTGYRSLVGTVCDLAYRMAVLNPQLKRDVVKLTPGIVLIDELDLHLHPKWQWRVIKALQLTFPKVQFITTTHSPILIASMKSKRIITIGEEKKDESPKELEIQMLQDAKGWRVSDVLEKYMHTGDRAEEIQKKLKTVKELSLKKFNHLISQEELDLLEEIQDQLNDLLPEGDASLELAQLEPLNLVLERVKNESN